MHRLKNKKLLSLFLAGMIATVSVGIQYIYADDELNNNTEQQEVIDEIKDISVNDINNIDNINLKVKIKGAITKIEDSKIYIKDDSGEGVVLLDNIVLENIKEGNTIEVVGIVTLLEDINVISVDNIENINIIVSQEEIETQPEEVQKPDTQIETPKEESADSQNKLPQNSKPSNSGGNNTSKSEPIQLESSEIEVVSNNVAGKAVINISSELTDSQWEKVKTALEEGYIKVKDLPNNKIRITKVSSEKGDTIWLVNDPRMLDTEVEEVDIVNSKSIVLVNSINYEDYDITQTKWNSIVDDIIDGNAKIKLLSNGDLKTIYTKSSGEDSTSTISKL